jgi:ankyrin repeat protein
LTGSGQNPEFNKELLSAAAKGDTQKVEFLLSQGADVNARDDNFGLTPLMRAIRGGHFETARLIALRAAASKDGWAAADEKDNTGRTALMHAANAGRLDMVKFLVEECGADIKAKDSEGRTVMDYAPVSDDPGMAQYLAQGPRAGTSGPVTGLDIVVKFLRNAFIIALWCVVLKFLLR